MRAFAALVSLLPCLVSALPNVKRWPNAVGALYVLSNADQQGVLVSAINKDGTAEFAWVVPTGDKGTGPRGPDPLQAQDGLVVWNQTLFAVNPASNSVSMFSIDPNDPVTITKCGDNSYSGGDYPTNLGVSPDGSMACVSNSGSKDGLQCFTVGWDGLTPIDGAYFPYNLNQTDPPVGPPLTPSDVIWSKDGSMVYSSVKGAGMAGGMMGYVEAFNVANGMVTYAGRIVPNDPSLAFSMTHIPGSDALFVTDPATGVDLVAFNSDGSTNMSETIPIPGSMAPCWSEYSPKSQMFYVADIGTAQLTAMSVPYPPSNTTAKITSQTNITTSAGMPASLVDLSIASFDPEWDYIYQTSAADQVVHVFAVNEKEMKWIQDYELGKMGNNTGMPEGVTGPSIEGSAIYLKSGWAM